jgi:hypothetical protein
VVGVAVVGNFIPCTRAGPRNSFLYVLRQYLDIDSIVENNFNHPDIDSIVSMSEKDDHLPSLNRSGDLFRLLALLIPYAGRCPLFLTNYTRDGRSYVRTSIGSISMYFARCHRHRPASPRTAAVLFCGSDCCSVFDWFTSPESAWLALLKLEESKPVHFLCTFHFDMFTSPESHCLQLLLLLPPQRLVGAVAFMLVVVAVAADCWGGLLRWRQLVGVAVFMLVVVVAAAAVDCCGGGGLLRRRWIVVAAAAPSIY